MHPNDQRRPLARLGYAYGYARTFVRQALAKLKRDAFCDARTLWADGHYRGASAAYRRPSMGVVEKTDKAA